MKARLTGKLASGVIALGALAAATLLPIGAASAADFGPYSGHSQAIAVHVDSVTSGTTRLTNVNAGVASSALNSANLSKKTNAFGNSIIPAAVQGKKSFGEGMLAQVTVAAAPDATPQLDGPVALTRLAAPGDEPAAKSVVNTVNASPGVYARSVTTSAEPSWNGVTCILGDPISQGGFEAAKLQLAETGADTATNDFDKAVASISADAAGPERAAVDTRAINQLYDGRGDGFGLVSAAFAEIAPVTLFEGTAAEVTVDIGGPAILRAMADGTAAGAKVEFDAPLVSIVQEGARNVILPNDTIKLIEVPAGGTVLRVRSGVIHEESKSATSVSATGAVLTVEVLRSAVPNLQGVTLSIGHLEAASAVPAGGIRCPIQVTVTANPDSTRTGRTVDVTTTVFNHFECPLNDVTLIDTLTVEKQAAFTIVDAPGAIEKTPGTFLTRGVIKWNVGSIPARESRSRTFTLRADDGAGKINVGGNADGVLANCLVRQGSDSASVTGIGRATAGVTGISPRVPVSVSKVLGAPITPGKDLPATGVASSAVMGISMLAAAGGSFGLLRRRKIL